MRERGIARARRRIFEIAEGRSEKYSSYLSKLGFEKNQEGLFEKTLVPAQAAGV